MSIQNDSLVLTMNTEIPIQSNMTVQNLIDVLNMVPDKNARVGASHYTSSGYGGGGTTYKLKLNWTKVMER